MVVKDKLIEPDKCQVCGSFVAALPEVGSLQSLARTSDDRFIITRIKRLYSKRTAAGSTPVGLDAHINRPLRPPSPNRDPERVFRLAPKAPLQQPPCIVGKTVFNVM